MAITPTTLLGNASLSETKQAQLRFSLRFRRQRLLLALLHTVGGAVLAADAGSQTFRISPSIALQETLTNNVNLSPAVNAESDLVTQITPTFGINANSAHSALNGSISLPILLYARTGAENNSLQPSVSLLAHGDAFNRYAFIEASADISQNYFSPFGAQPQDLSNATNNRYTSQTYRISPYIQHGSSQDLQYTVRDDNIWTTLNGSAISDQNGISNFSYTNQFLASVSRQPAQWGWGADYSRTSVDFSGQAPLLTQVGRVHLLDRVDSALELNADVGYEDNDYPASHFRGSVYGIGGTWHPTNRTSLNLAWEHRFFGSSYVLNFTHTTPLTVWNLNASRNISSYPQQIAGIPAGFDVAALVNQLFLSSIPDPVQRQAFVNQFINDRGLPSTLAEPINIYTQQITLQEQANASVTFIGARNTVAFSLYYLRQQPITASGVILPPQIDALNNNTQEGGGVVWSHNFSSRLTGALSATVSRSIPNGGTTTSLISATKNGSLLASLSYPLTAQTSLSGGARYQVLTGNQANGYTEAAVFASITHSFR